MADDSSIAGDEDTLESWIEKSRRLLKQPLRNEIEWRRIEINRGRWYQGVKNFISAMYGASEARRFTKSLPSINIHDSHYTKAQRGLAQVSAGIIFLDTLRGLPTRKDVTQTVTLSGESGPLSSIEEVDRLLAQALQTQEATRGQYAADNTAQIIRLRRELLRAIQLYSPDGTGYYERAQAYISENKGVENRVEGRPTDGIIDIGRKPLTGQLIDILHEVHSALERAEHAENTSGTRAATMPLPISDTNRKIFIVHGRDDAIRTNMENLLMRLDFDPIILSQQPVAGSVTIIEQIEQHTDVPFGIVLMTGDDWGYLDGHETEKKKRARQNVILELGYLWAKLTRPRVLVCFSGHNIELPTDVEGVHRISLSDSSWKNDVARALAHVGWVVDYSRIR